jgi:hypothetical protein
VAKPVKDRFGAGKKKLTVKTGHPENHLSCIQEHSQSPQKTAMLKVNKKFISKRIIKPRRLRIIHECFPPDRTNMLIANTRI